MIPDVGLRGSTLWAASRWASQKFSVLAAAWILTLIFIYINLWPESINWNKQTSIFLSRCFKRATKDKLEQMPNTLSSELSYQVPFRIFFISNISINSSFSYLTVEEWKTDIKLSLSYSHILFLLIGYRYCWQKTM